MGALRGVRALFDVAPGTRPAALNGLINGVAVAAPLVAGLVVGAPESGALACLGAYVAAFTNKGGPRRSRTLGLCTAAVANAVAFLLGAFTSHLFVVAVVLVTALVFIAAMGSAVNATAARLGTMPATAFLASSIAAGRGWIDVLVAAALVMTGGLWYAAVTGLATPAPRVEGILASVAEPLVLLGRCFMARADGRRDPAEHEQLVAAVRRAEAAVVAIATPSGDEALARALTRIVNQAEVLVDLSAALDDLGPVDDAIAVSCRGALGEIGAEIAAVGTQLAGRTKARSMRGDALADVTAACDSVRSAVRNGTEPYSRLVAVGRYRRILESLVQTTAVTGAAVDTLDLDDKTGKAELRTADEPRRAPVDLARLRAAMTLTSVQYRHALRITAITAGFYAVVAALGLPHGEWGILAVLRVLRPQYGATVERAGQRVIGNVIGGSCAAVLIAWVHQPAALVIVLFAVITIGFTLRPINYAFWVIFGTPLVLLIGDISDPGDWSAALARIVMTLVGSAVALAGGYVLWPSWERDRMTDLVRAASDASQTFLSESLRAVRSPNADRLEQARRTAEEKLADARAAALRARREPGAAATPDADAALDGLTRLQRHLAALSALPKSSAAQIPALDDYIRSAATSLTGSDTGQSLAAQEQALETMFAYLERVHRERMTELPVSGAADTRARAEIRENGPLIASFAAITGELGSVRAARDTMSSDIAL
ncbi:FUSC family protein [Antrihabitans sp. YC2-6]|uniref:FUSC family protein n=1 Tax=Antrihabitans sp. YC2-6 TaxID=2799498 RepID=UPI0018F4B230|nr:FUSC family protein [Antrihabitans sp. YC2-6]MBJ8347968.1 FUSC family protein [Antrihabitans sp. YC2-6]